jgi:hypothetical protein
MTNSPATFKEAKEVAARHGRRNWSKKIANPHMDVFSQIPNEFMASER